MTVVVLGSNREANLTAVFAQHVQKLLAELGEASQLIDLSEMPGEVLHPGMYDGEQVHPYLADAQAKLFAANRWIFLFPEYNGTYPGVLKVFIDCLSVIDYLTTFRGKTAALIGTASGRSGNVRGLDHFSTVLDHLGTAVMPQALPISMIKTLIDAEGMIHDAATDKALRDYLARYQRFAQALAPTAQA